MVVYTYGINLQECRNKEYLRINRHKVYINKKDYNLDRMLHQKYFKSVNGDALDISVLISRTIRHRP